MQSTSSVVHAHLMASGKGYTFTTDGLYNTLSPHHPGISRGGIGGFANRAVSEGALAVVGKDGRHIKFSLVDGSALANMVTKKTSGPGGGHSGKRKPTVVTPTRQSIASALLDIAAKLELIEPDLTIVSTDDLLAELVRRQKHG